MNCDVFKDFNLGRAITNSLQQIIEYKEGDNTKARVVPMPLHYSAQDVVRVRNKYNLTQKKLAEAMNVSRRTVEGWETGKKDLGGAASKLLYLIEKREEVIEFLLNDVI